MTEINCKLDSEDSSFLKDRQRIKEPPTKKRKKGRKKKKHSSFV